LALPVEQVHVISSNLGPVALHHRWFSDNVNRAHREPLAEENNIQLAVCLPFWFKK
jgi:hypothetical protein